MPRPPKCEECIKRQERYPYNEPGGRRAVYGDVKYRQCRRNATHGAYCWQHAKLHQEGSGGHDE